MKKQADKCLKDTLRKGSGFFLKLQAYVQTSVAKQGTRKLAFRFYGPFRLLQKVGKVVYKLDLPATSQIHQVIHVSQLKKAVGATAVVQPQLPAVANADAEPDQILGTRWRLVEKCQSLASWEMVCQPKAKGGLGVISLKIQNQGLLLKSLDKFYRKCDIPWVQLVWSEHYDDKVPHAWPPCGSFWWRDVMSIVDIFRGITKCEIKAGDNVLLWKDNWIDPPLCISSARLFSFTLNKDISVKKFVESMNHEEFFQLPKPMRS